MAATSFRARRDVYSWGRVVRRTQRVAEPKFRDELPGLVAAARGPLLATGRRRSYGDSCLNSEGMTIDMRGVDRLLAFDAGTGVLQAEAGVSLSQIIAFAAPRGWFLPTTPGTRFVTLGGAVANDVHGKNHHRAGSFGNHVVSFDLLRRDGFQARVTKKSDPDLFAATIGGLGLTGVICTVELQLERIRGGFLDVETIPHANLAEFWELAEESAAGFEHTVSWIDAVARGANFGRGVFSRANWRPDDVIEIHGDDRTWKTLPFDAPSRLLNRYTVGGFNELYFRKCRAGAGKSVQHYAPFFYPLDAIHDWNRLYGSRGMFQYQCVVPPGAARAAIATLLREIVGEGQASFLAVLKTFGDKTSPGFLSFPRPGATLALDFPNSGQDTLALMSRLDSIVMEAGGALYPAKDGRLAPETFRRSFPKLQEFLRHKDERMESDFWRRVAG
ncbi:MULTISPECIES: FAD-binding oxidoreductase [Methylosinus]|uniref:FAD-binding oxidoreductase n=1 Tax=Methylosinus TaxID=425 RepID=UPI000463D211|nr:MULTISPECIES: FAD-binding oxidoreductase [Methylosinus]OBS53486.1 FAD-linked oxidase [Methylosinus sp. 3S-1]